MAALEGQPPGVTHGEQTTVLLISGFLGAGKTTLIRHLLESSDRDMGRLALIVNEFGQIGIDGTLLRGRDMDMVELTNGCICCTIKSDFSRALQEIHQRVRPNTLLVEATGVAQPGDILDALFDDSVRQWIRLVCLVTVVDVEMFKARELLGPFYDNQIRCADVVVLNKIDLLDGNEVREVDSMLEEMNPAGIRIPATYCAVDSVVLFGARSSTGEADLPVHHGHDHHTAADFQTFSFRDSRPIDRDRLKGFLETLPPNLFRLKGWIRFPDASVLLDFAAGRYRMTPSEGRERTALDFVGRNCNEAEILSGLKACLITEPSEP
jgi:G3E family GTPase